MLAIFDGGPEEKEVQLHLPGFISSCTETPPAIFLARFPGKTVKEKIELEIYSNAGIRGQSEQLVKLLESVVGA